MEELAGLPFVLADDPEGARHVVGMRPAPGTREPVAALLRLHRGLRQLAGDYGPRSVYLPSPATDVHGWEEAFGARVRFGRPAALLRLPAGVLSERVGVVPRSALARQVRQALTERLGGGTATLQDIARTIPVHPRTLQRSLLDEGLTFTEILDCVRRERARADLTGTDLPFATISVRLGFAEPAVLSRCARRWWGRSPSQMRDGPAYTRKRATTA